VRRLYHIIWLTLHTRSFRSTHEIEPEIKPKEATFGVFSRRNRLKQRHQQVTAYCLASTTLSLRFLLAPGSFIDSSPFLVPEHHTAIRMIRGSLQ